MSFRIKMKIDMKGSNDGVTVVQYKEGEIYECPRDISPSLVEVFIRENWAIKGKERNEENVIVEVEKCRVATVIEFWSYSIMGIGSNLLLVSSMKKPIGK